MTFRLITTIAICAAMISSVNYATATQNTQKSTVSSVQTAKPFVKKRYSIKGEWSLSQVDGVTQIIFSDDFKTMGGPDLKIYLSKNPIEQLDSETAEQGAVKIGVLKSKSGGQTYTLPSGINLTEYKSVIIHCEAYSVLWGGFDIPEMAGEIDSSQKR